MKGDKMSSESRSNTDMVETLTTLFKHVRFLGYGSSDLRSLDPPLGILNQSLRPISSSDSLFSQDSSSSTLETYYQQIPYSNSASSVSSASDYSSSSPEAESFPSFTYLREDFSDKFDVEDEDDVALGLDRRRIQHNLKEEQHLLSLPEYSLSEVSLHDTFSDCWMILYDKVYDVTNFLLEHPGGEELLMEHAGRDATIAFRGVGHSQAALKSLQEYLIGVLLPSERIFTSWETR